jgi:hypothetical protein
LIALRAESLVLEGKTDEEIKAALKNEYPKI